MRGHQVLPVRYNALLHNPEPIVAELDRFLGGGLDTSAMVQAIAPSLYRQKGPRRGF